MHGIYICDFLDLCRFCCVPLGPFITPTVLLQHGRVSMWPAPRSMAAFAATIISQTSFQALRFCTFFQTSTPGSLLASSLCDNSFPCHLRRCGLHLL